MNGRNLMSRRHFLNAASGAVLGALFMIYGNWAAAAGKPEESVAWDKLSESEKEKIYERWQKFKALTPEAREELRQSLREFEALPQAQKKRIEENYARWKEFSPEQREELKSRFARWQELPEATKNALREIGSRWDSLTEEERAALLKSLSSRSAK